MNDIRAAKVALRREVRTRMRSTWTDERRIQVSQSICTQIEQSAAFAVARRIALYRALPDEVDLTPLMERYCATRELYIPRVEGEDINFYRYQGEELALSGQYQIEEPIAPLSAAIAPELLDLIIVPGMAFDRTGMRLGRGKGYYDRYFERCPQVTRLAVVATERLVEQVPSEPWDVPMHLLATECELITIH